MLIQNIQISNFSWSSGGLLWWIWTAASSTVADELSIRKVALRLRKADNARPYRMWAVVDDDESGVLRSCVTISDTLNSNMRVCDS